MDDEPFCRLNSQPSVGMLQNKHKREGTLIADNSFALKKTNLDDDSRLLSAVKHRSTV